MDEDLTSGHLLAERFRLVRKLGRGAVGNVWLARDSLLHDEPVACKVLNQAFAGDRRAIADLKREVLLTRKLRHPNIVSIHSFFESHGTHFITMEYVEGKNLAQLLSLRETPFSLADILPWIEQVSHALDHAHGQGVLHRDVKPANILMTKEDEVLLADFGIARTAREASSRATGQVTSGTLLFMSPEQLMGEPLDQRSDLYSMASCVYELLSGSPPFYKGAIVSQIRSKEPAPIAYCGDAVNRVLLKALNKDPNRRYDTCGQFFDALAQVAGYAKPAASPTLGATRFNMHADLVDPNAETIPLPPEHVEGMTKPLGALLVEAGLITEDQLLEALISHNTTRERLGAMLIRLGFVSPQTIAETLQHQLHVQSACLPAAAYDPSLLKLVPQDLARRFRCIPLRREAGRILVAMADPLDFQALNDLEARLGIPVEPCIATEAEVHSAIETAYRRQPGEH